MTAESFSETSFTDLNLDPRLVSALKQADITKATLIQEKAIPLALVGKDILARAKTGSGKTFSYLLPILHNILLQKAPSGQTLCVIIVPTKELSIQLQESIELFVPSCFPLNITFANLSSEDHKERLISAIRANPHILISTPSRIADNCQYVSWSTIKYFVVDEADYIFSYGYSEDLDKIIPLLPKLKQSFLMSATISEDIEKIKSLLLRNAVTLKLELGEREETGKLEQFSIQLQDDSDKFLLVFAIFKLSLLKGKMIIFARDVERAYKLRIFLEEFGVRSCCINPDFPLSCRQHIVEEFNKGAYDILIAPDSATTSSMCKESGIARGVDFKRVDVVINFDFPSSSESYVHRIGRTSRAGQSGTAVSFICSEDDNILLETIREEQKSLDRTIGNYSFDMTILDGFRYRMSDALRAVTRAVIKETQLMELKREMANSEKLKTLPPNRTEELSRILRHDRKTTVRQQPHLKHIPEYLLQTAGPSPLPQTCPNPSRRSIKASSAKVGKPSSKKSRSVDPLKGKNKP